MITSCAESDSVGTSLTLRDGNDDWLPQCPRHVLCVAQQQGSKDAGSQRRNQDHLVIWKEGLLIPEHAMPDVVCTAQRLQNARALTI